MTRIFPPASWAAKGLMGDWTQLALFLAVCAAAAAFTIWVLGYSYRKLALLQSEAPAGPRKKLRKDDVSFAGGSVFKACLQREIRDLLRVPAYATNALPTAFMPVARAIMVMVAPMGLT